MAKKDPAIDAPVEVRLLRSCALGECNDVVTVDALVAASAVADGNADDHPEAVSYAKSIKA